MYRILLACLLVVFAYFLIGGYLLHAKIPSLLFPEITLAHKTKEQRQFKIYDLSNNELLVREYGQPEKPCIVFFPGRHGGVNKYEGTLFQVFTSNQFQLFSISYPGQDGAAGRVDSISSLVGLIDEAMITILSKCSPEKIVIYGRSLGATIAVYSVKDIGVSGVILEGVAPSLSSAIGNHLKSNWYLRPLTIMPLDFLLPTNYELVEPLSSLHSTPVSIFQGTKDSQTPLGKLKQQWSYGKNVSLHEVKTGTHSNTYIQAIESIVTVAKTMLK